MLKVLINEEEVLTNKDFTIKKEMLNTPSVILNNVYPKSWEDEKDYTSNFYHPQDYSKCKIIDENVVPADPGETITGTSFTIEDNDITKLVELTELEGNTTQAGTPTPSSPQPINVVSGRQEVKVVGKNLLNITATSQTKNNIEFTINEDKTVLVNGKGNSSSYLVLGEVYLKANQTYMLSGCPSGGGSGKYALSIYDSNNTRIADDFGSGKTYTPTNSGIYKVGIQYWYNWTISNLTFKPQLEKGSTATEYEEFKGQSYEINLGKNLLKNTNVNSGDNNYWSSYSTYDEETGTITRSTTATTESTIIHKINLKNNTTYTISCLMKSNGNVLSSEIFAYNVGITKIYSKPIYDLSTEYQKVFFTFTTDSTTNFTNATIRFDNNGSTQSGTEAILTITDVMLVEGTDTEFAPYKTPIELCKINTYKDRIYKENGTWYLHKEIGKLVLNGSERWQVSGTNTSGYNRFTSSVIYNLIDKPSTTSQVADILANYFIKKSADNTYQRQEGISVGTNGNLYIYGDSLKEYTAEQFKTWLSTHNTTVYYVLATPTTTEITDSELISQLNAIELLEGLNNVSVSSADLPGKITIHYNYTEEQTIDDLLFCGVVKNSGNISLNPRQPHFQSLQILDFKTFLSEGELDSFVIYQKTILEAIQMVIANIQDYGFILGNVNILNPTDVIGAYSTKDKTAYDVFNYIADITQSRWTTRLIDENHVAIDFYDPTLMTEGTPINYTQTFFENNLIDDMTYSYGSNNYRNKQVMTSSQVYSNISQQQSIVANGYQTQFPTEQPIGKINSITSNGIPLTFATFNEKEMGYVADFYYSPGDNYFESEDLRTTGEILIIDYVAIVEGRQIITNPLEIDRINDSTGRKGIISRYEQRNDATTSTELQKIGESYIKYKGTPEIKLKISTRSNIWEVGQRVQFNAPIEELDTEYMVRTKKINYISTIDTIFYEYELISSFNSETEINYFDNQRAKASGNIGEGEYISRNIDIESTANIIFYDTETTEVQVDGDNVLNSILNSPFTS